VGEAHELPAVPDHFGQAHLALSRRSIREGVADFSNRCRARSNEDFEPDLEACR
jgi:hypothetical protein